MSRFRIVSSTLLLVVVLQGVTGVVDAQTVASTLPPGVSPRELADPLEPWSLEPGRIAVPPPLPPTVLPDTSGALPVEGAALPEADQTGLPPGWESEVVLVVECRQLLVSDPRKAVRLAGLLRSGATLEDARRALGSPDVDETTRQYAIDELQDDLRAEIDTLSAGDWSDVREWRGRSSLFQVVSKEERPRGTIPALGQGLGAAEMERLATEQRALSGQARAPAQPQPGDFEPATVVEQATPQYPPGIEESAEVSVQVEVGLSDDYIGARIIRSTNSLFDQPALDAAQRSSYRSARRNGIPERGTVTLNFRFMAPGQQPPPGTPPGTQPPRE